MTTSKRHIIKPCNNVYKATTTMAIALTGIIALFILRSSRSKDITLAMSIFTFLLMAFYRTYLLFDEEYIDIAYNGNLNIYNELLFYPCNIVVITYLIGLIGHLRPLIAFSFFYSICPIAALLFPGEGFTNEPFFKPRVFFYYTSHYLIMMMMVFVVASDIYMPEFKDIIPSALLCLLFSFLAYLFNCFLIKTGLNLKANYFYNYDPDGNPLLESLYEHIPHPFLFTLPVVGLSIITSLILVIITHLLV